MAVLRPCPPSMTVRTVHDRLWCLSLAELMRPGLDRASRALLLLGRDTGGRSTEMPDL